MAQCMGRYWFRNSGLIHILPQDFPGSHARQRLSARVEEKNALAFTLLERWAQLAEINGNRSNGATPDRDQSLFGAFAEYAHEVVLQHHVTHVERNPLRHSQAGAICELEHRSVAKCEWLVE